MASLPPMDPKGKKAMMIAGGLIVLNLLYWYVLWAPDHKEIVAIAAHADSLDERNYIDSLDVARGNEAKFKADAARYNNLLSGLRRLVPTQNQVPALLEAISNDARQVGLELSEFAQDGTLAGDEFDMVKYRFGVIGPYHKIAEFLTAVASSPRIITPINIQLQSPSRTIERKPAPGETFVEVKFGVITYVAKPKPGDLGPVAAPTPTKPGGP